MNDAKRRGGFASVFIAVFLGTSLVVAAMIVNAKRPITERQQPSAEFVQATGKCAECHRKETSAIVHEFEMSRHSKMGVTCLDCHRPAPGQKGMEHRGFTITTTLTALNCSECHSSQYQQFLRSRHAGSAWTAVSGNEGFSVQQLEETRRYHPEAVDRQANPLTKLEGEPAIRSGCESCHGIGRPNADGSFGSCTACHSRHNASIALARQPATCGQCHMGPDHSQIEIYNESKHGVLFEAQRETMNLRARPQSLSTRDMPVPTCATCHMSGLEGMKATHDTTERLSWYLFAAVSTRRPGYAQAQAEMKEVCEKCHESGRINQFYTAAEKVVDATNQKVKEAMDIVAPLRAANLLTPQPFDESIEFTEFDLWHYYGRTAKHGAFMGGADFVQWHGNYELLRLRDELRGQAKAIQVAARTSASAGVGAESKPAANPETSSTPSGKHDANP
jgi:hydroxylamine dehydrogenase